jgi:hypothetical protein
MHFYKSNGRLCGLVARVPGYKFSESLVELGIDPEGRVRFLAVEFRSADYATPSIRKMLALTSPTSGGHSVGIVRLRTKYTELHSSSSSSSSSSYYYYYYYYYYTFNNYSHCGKSRGISFSLFQWYHRPDMLFLCWTAIALILKILT